MDVFLIRHAHAGSRMFGSHDRYRQLTDEGREQAHELAGFLSSTSLAALYSSPATRCVQTIEPVAEAIGLSVIEHEDLWEDVGLPEVMSVVEEACDRHDGHGNVAVCSHGNLIPAIVEHLAHQGIPVSGRGCERASIWKLTRDGDRWTEAKYLTPRSSYQG